MIRCRAGGLALALGLLPSFAFAQQGFLPGGTEIFSVSFVAGSALPPGVSISTGNAEIVSKDGTGMLRAASPTEVLLQLPQVLPKDFTLEFELVPKACCNPHDLSVEGTASINQGPASAHILWDSDGALAVIGGGEQYSTAMPDDLKASLPGSLTQVGISMQDGTLRMYTNGRRLFTLQERRFSRGRVLRVFLGGQDAGTQAVHLARIRVATGPPRTVIATAAPAAAPVAAIATPAPAPVVAAPAPAPSEPMIREPVPAAAGEVAATGLAPVVRMGEAGPIVSWTAGPAGSTYSVSRIKREDPACCENRSPADPPIVGTTWQDAPLTSDGTYIYSVTATGAFGTMSGTASFAWTRPAPTEVLASDRPTEAPAPMPATAPAAAPVAPIQVGTGISDITGPIAEVGMMGYGSFGQSTGGLHTRLYARAFVFADALGGRRVVFVSAELGQLFSSVKHGVLKKLATLFGTRYDASNVMISATHTHSGPGGYSHHVMYNLTTFGHIAQNFDVIVDGITEAIVKADSSLAPATVSVMTAEVAESTMINRSMRAFRLNPEILALGPEGGEAVSINRELTLLQVRRSGRPVGVIAWHAVHNTSMPNTNHLVSSDHKGYASYLFEKEFGSIAPLRNYGGFVAAFPNGAEGDMSPNLNNDDPKHFYGPGANELESTALIGRREFAPARSLLDVTAGQTPVGGDVDYRHAFVMMPGYVVQNTAHTNGVGGKALCPAAYGASFMAGAEDGPSGPLGEGLALGSGMDQAALETVRAELIAVVAAFVPPAAPMITDMMLRSADSDRCQYPKPVLIPTGHYPNWTPEILPFQLFRIGSVAIAGIPGEMTIQGGRRLEAALEAALLPLGVTEVILTGLANEYSGYITTPEEYGSQEYEGASTLYGRLTFDAYKEIFVDLAVAMALNRPATVGGLPAPDLALVPQIELQTGVIQDGVPQGAQFGQIVFDAELRVARGREVRVAWRSGHPKNDLRRNNSYVRIERSLGGDRWELVGWDATPDTRLWWVRDPECPIDLCPWSRMAVVWSIPHDAVPGAYRIRFVGSSKDRDGALTRYQGTSQTFTVE
jgi:neutral ceramidase